MTGERCNHYYHRPRTWAGPAEFVCRHPESPSGDCADGDCPLVDLQPLNPCDWCGEEIPEGDGHLVADRFFYHHHCCQEEEDRRAALHFKRDRG